MSSRPPDRTIFSTLSTIQPLRAHQYRLTRRARFAVRTPRCVTPKSPFNSSIVAKNCKTNIPEGTPGHPLVQWGFTVCWGGKERKVLGLWALGWAKWVLLMELEWASLGWHGDLPARLVRIVTKRASRIVRANFNYQHGNLAILTSSLARWSCHSR